MIIRKITEQDLPELYGWFEERKWPYPPVERIVPEWGFVSEKNGVMLACAFAYITGTSVAFIDWTATNPKVDEATSVKGLVEVIEYMKEAFKNAVPAINAMTLFTTNSRLADRFEKTGFKKQDKYFRCLWINTKT